MSIVDFESMKIKHEQWFDNLEEYLTESKADFNRKGKAQSEFDILAWKWQEEEKRNPGEKHTGLCPLSQWLQMIGLSTYGSVKEVRRLDEVHDELHENVVEIINLKNDDQFEAAKQLFLETKKKLKEIVKILDSLDEKLSEYDFHENISKQNGSLFFRNFNIDYIMEKVDSFILRAWFLLFKTVSRFFNYTFAVAFTTSIGGLLIAANIGVFLSSTLKLKESGTFDVFVETFILATIIIYIIGYYVHFGLLWKIKIPCFSKKLCIINKFIDHNGLKSSPSDEDLSRLLAALENLPKQNMVAALIYPGLVMLSVFIQEIRLGTMYNALLLLGGISSAIFIYVFFTYISAELLTGITRKRIKRILVLRGISFPEMAYLSIRKKFLFIGSLVFIFMAGIIFMINLNRGINAELLVFIGLSVLILYLILFLYLMSIEEALEEIEKAATNLARGGKGKLYISSMDRELVTVSKGIIAASYEVNAVRNNLEKRVDERTRDLNNVLKDLREKEKIINNELAIAADIQEGILPVTPLHYNCMNMVAHYQSMEEIGGDFYDIFYMEGGKIAVLMGDVSGHGIPAALVTTMAKIGFTDATRQFQTPKEIFNHVNKSLLAHVKTQDYLTAFLVIINENYEVIYGNASHRKALVIRHQDNSIEEWDTDGLFVGALEDAEYGQKRDQLHFGDRIFLYTDGLVEARSSEDEEFGEDRLKKLLLETKPMPPRQAKTAILQNFQQFTGMEKINDDVTFLLLDLNKDCKKITNLKKKSETLYHEKKYAEAVETLEEGLAIDSKNRFLHQLLAKSYLKLENYEKAIYHLNHYLTKQRTDADGFYLLALAQFNMKVYTESLSAALTACQLKNNFKRAMFIAAYSFKELKNKDEEIRIWKKILSIDPSNKTAAEELAKYE